MRLLKLTPLNSFKRYVFKDPDTGYEYEAPSFTALKSRILVYRIQNQLPMIEMLHEVLEHYLCQLPENIGACTAYKTERSIMGIMKGGIALLKNFYYGDENIVEKDLADARAAICIECPLNKLAGDSKAEKLIERIALASIGDRVAKGRDRLGMCDGCGCCMRAKVWLKQEAIQLSNEEKETMRKGNANCWQIKG